MTSIYNAIYHEQTIKDSSKIRQIDIYNDSITYNYDCVLGY